MNIKLNPKCKDMLIEVKKRYKWQEEFNFQKHPSYVVLQNLEEDSATELRELCSDYLIEVGFDEEYSTNKKGELLEKLIEKLYVE